MVVKMSPIAVSNNHRLYHSNLIVESPPQNACFKTFVNVIIKEGLACAGQGPANPSFGMATKTLKDVLLQQTPQLRSMQVNSKQF